MGDATARARNIKMLGLDIDGVLTDGRMTYTDDGLEIKSFNVRDGHGIVMALRGGLKIVAVSGRKSRINRIRLREWGITEIHQKVRGKEIAMASILEAHGLDWSQLAYMGDDVVDLRVLSKCGLAMAPADADPEVKKLAHWTATAGGGQGCVREALEMILQAQGQWEQLMERYR